MTRDRKILIKDWYEGLYELGEEEINLLNEKNERVDLSALKKEFGIEKFVLDREGVEAIKARTYEPTANIQGMVSGYTGPGHKTIVPNEARVRIDFRLLPHMNPQKCIEKVKKHLIDHGFGHLEVIAFDAAEPPYKISVKEDISQAIIKAAEEVFGEKPVVNGVSAEGTILKHVWMPTVLTGFANPGANLHAPDENIHVENYIKGIKYAAAIMENFSKE
jgi:acetylornithine deacetylase/succinyl-diaminopimelate desuccinylase-like protein